MTQQNALFCFTYGLYVIGAKTDTNRFAGCVIDAVMQTTCVPPRMVMSCVKKNATAAALLTHPEFTLSVLPEDVDPFVIGNFGFQSSRDVDKWKNVPHEIINGLPVLTQHAAYVRARVTETRDLGSHLLFFCDVLDGNVGSGTALSYTCYQQHLKQKTADALKKGPTAFHAPAAKKGDTSMNDTKEKEVKGQWICTVCGYVYDGDIPFEDLPDDYLCPVCGEPKSAFVKQ